MLPEWSLISSLLAQDMLLSNLLKPSSSARRLKLKRRRRQSRVLSARGIQKYCPPEEAFRRIVRRRRYLRVLFGGGIQDYCPPEQAFRRIIRQRRHSGCSVYRLQVQAALRRQPVWEAITGSQRGGNQKARGRDQNCKMHLLDNSRSNSKGH